MNHPSTRAFGALTLVACLAGTAPAASQAAPGTPSTSARIRVSAACDPAVDARATAARADGEQGTTQLKLHVSPQGDVQRAEVLRSSGWPRLDRLARTALSRCTADAARDAQGNPVAGSTVVEYVWAIH